MSKETRSMLCFSLAMCIIGSSVVVSKLAMVRLPLALAIEFRLLVALLVLLPFLLPDKNEAQPQNKKTGWTLFWQACAGVFGFNLFLLYGLQHTTAADASIVTGTQPAVTALLGWLLLRERIKTNEWLMVLLATLGVAALGFRPHEQASGMDAAAYGGILLVFAAIICEGLFTIFGKQTPVAVSPMRRAAWLCMYSFLLFLPFALWEARTFDWSTLRASDFGIIAYLGLVVTVVAYVLFFTSIPHLKTQTAAVLGGLIPASSLVLSLLLLGEQITWVHLIGLGLILVALVPLRGKKLPGAKGLAEKMKG